MQKVYSHRSKRSSKRRLEQKARLYMKIAAYAYIAIVLGTAVYFLSLPGGLLPGAAFLFLTGLILFRMKRLLK